jgi:hypothetical protein
MDIRIGHASIDENGTIAGGKEGDQTKKEICTRAWYDKDWDVCIECLDNEMAAKAARIMEQICKDDNYGYDQTQRWTGYHSIRKLGRITGGKGEFDCATAVMSSYILAGLRLKKGMIETPEKFTIYTGSLEKILIDTGMFRAHIEDAYVKTSKYAKPGTIYLKKGSHVVMALEDGVGENPYPVPNTTIYYDVVNSKIVCKGDTVKWVQYELINDGITVAEVDGVIKKLSIDGECGKITDAAIRVYQDKHGLLVDGKVGPSTRKSFIQH